MKCKLTCVVVSNVLHLNVHCKDPKYLEPTNHLHLKAINHSFMNDMIVVENLNENHLAKLSSYCREQRAFCPVQRALAYEAFGRE